MLFEIIMQLCLCQKLLELEDISEDERKELLSKIDSLESIVRMLELKTKNSHDHGTIAIGSSSLPIHSSSLYSRVEDLVFLFVSCYVHFCAYFCIRFVVGVAKNIEYKFIFFLFALFFHCYFYITSHVFVIDALR